MTALGGYPSRRDASNERSRGSGGYARILRVADDLVSEQALGESQGLTYSRAYAAAAAWQGAADETYIVEHLNMMFGTKQNIYRVTHYQQGQPLKPVYVAATSRADAEAAVVRPDAEAVSTVLIYIGREQLRHQLGT